MGERLPALVGRLTPRRAEAASPTHRHALLVAVKTWETGLCGIHFFQPVRALLHDREPLANFEAAGVIHTVMVATELMPIYEYIDCKLARTTARVLGPSFSWRHVNQGAPQ